MNRIILSLSIIIAMTLSSALTTADSTSAKPVSTKSSPSKSSLSKSSLNKSSLKQSLASMRPVTIYKSPTCGCCEAWVEHLENSGFNTRIKHPDNLDDLRKELGISPKYQACHTGVKQGYVFEGHVPAAIIKKFLSEKRKDVIGLSVPGMPFGSPGMDAVGESFSPYEVLLLKKDGGSELYARVSPTETVYLNQ